MSNVAVSRALLLLSSLLSVSWGAPMRAKKFSLPPPEDLEYDVFWGLASRTFTDPFGNSTAAGSCRRLVGPPNPDSYKRKQCKAEVTMSWVPSLKTPRLVDVRFDPTPTILASRGLAVEVQMLDLGVLRPAISSIEYVLTLPGSPGPIPIPIYTAEEADEYECPGFNVFPIPPYALRPIGDLLLDGALVLGVRIKMNDGSVGRRTDMASISSVGLRVLKEGVPAPPAPTWPPPAP